VNVIRRIAGLVSPGDIRRFGDAALVFGTHSPDAAGALGEAVRAVRVDGVIEAVAGIDSVLVIYDPEVLDFEALAGRIRLITARRARRGPKRVVEVPTAFDGPDLDEVGRITGLGSEGVVEALLKVTFRVSILGFTPGFAYLSGLPRSLRDVPRRTTPRPSVPAGSFAIAGGHAAVYPQSTPGGWQLLGRTDTPLFDPEVSPYALLAPGDLVRIREVAPDRVSPPAPDSPVRAARRSSVGCIFEVESPGLLTTIQDQGRRGLGHLGVPRAGAADPVSFALANALVGNRPDSACLEATVIGPTLVCRRATHVAVLSTGAEVTLDGLAVGTGRVIPVGPGQRLAIGRTGGGLRSYLAVRGGFAAPIILGSRSTDRLVGLGCGPIVRGDELDAGEPTGSMADHLLDYAPGQAPVGERRRVRALVVPGATHCLPESLFGRPFIVVEPSDRVGLRLQPRDGAPIQVTKREVHSAGTTIGAVQLPPDGNPVVLMADHATLGGYPVAAVVISADLGELGRCRPGDTIELSVVSPEEALSALRSLRRSMAEVVVGTYPVAAG
jgi:KipI family sensor histidine kinase inhibitor